MGYSSVHMPLGTRVSTLEGLRKFAGIAVGDACVNSQTGTTIKTVALSAGPGGAYGINQYVQTDGLTYFIAFVVLVERKNGEFLWKCISETAGPNRDEAPAALLKKLTALSNLDDLLRRGILCEQAVQYAKNWRERAVKAAQCKAKLQVGAKLTFNEPVSFGPGYPKVTRFLVTEAGRKRRFTALCDDGTSFPCRLSGIALSAPHTIS